MSERTCKFYVNTALGRRCILMSVEDWRRRRAKLMVYCEGRANGCPVLKSYYSKERPGLRFLSEIRGGFGV